MAPTKWNLGHPQEGICGWRGRRVHRTSPSWARPVATAQALGCANASSRAAIPDLQGGGGDAGRGRGAEPLGDPRTTSVALSRRHLLLGATHAACVWEGLQGAASAAEAVPAASAASAPSASSLLQPLLPSPAADLLAQLEGRAPIYQPGVAWALRNRDRQLFYPAWMAGEWEVTARFAAASFPQGRRLLGRTVPGVLKGSMVAALPDVGAAMEAPLSYRARYVASEEEGGVVADRVFNVRQLMDAFYGFDVTRKVEYEPVKNPTRLTVVYATPRQDRSVISEDLRKAELIINNRITQQLSPTDFVCGELFRQISQAAAQGFVGDYETISRFTLLPPGGPPAAPAAAAAAAAVSEIDPPAASTVAGPPPDAPSAPAPALGRETGGAGAGVGSRVHVLQRVAAFLQPQDAAFFEAGNQAVAAYDYVYDMIRVV